MQLPPIAVSHAVQFSLAGHARRYALTLTYTNEAPWQVAIDFPGQAVRDQRDARWVIARELLLEGLRRPAGEGDVRILPREVSTVFELRSGFGSAWLSVRTDALRAFLGDTLALVPVGRESDHVDWDAALAQLHRRRPGHTAQ